jgi:hypothetical protein
VAGNPKGFDVWKAPPERKVAHEFEPDAERVRGMVTSGGWSWPFAVLTVDARWCRISSSGLASAVWAGRDEVEKVRVVRYWNSKGLMFDAYDHSFDGLIFTRVRLGPAIDVLVRAHWPVLTLGGTFRGAAPGPARDPGPR